MRKLSAAVLALSFAMLGIAVLTHGKPLETAQDEKKSMLMDIKGSLQAEGTKITFVADDCGKFWEVSTPGALQGQVGHHVQLSAHVYADMGQIHVMPVTML